MDLYLNRAINGSCTDVAIWIYKSFEYKYVCSSLPHNEWYRYEKHQWKTNDVKLVLKKFLLKENRIPKLRNLDFKNKVLDECHSLFYKRKFEEKLDKNVNLIGFKNGIFNLNRNVFRAGHHSDLVSMSTNIEYNEYMEDSKEYKIIDNFLKQTVPNVEIRDYVLKLFSTYLSGIQYTGENLYIFKSYSPLIDLLRISLGSYCKIISCVKIPEPMKLRGTRLLISYGLSDKSKIKSIMNVSKQYVMCDKPLHSDTISYRPQFKLLFICDHIPDHLLSCQPIMRRIRKIQITNAKLVNMDKYKSVFVYILLKYYQKYLVEGLVEPKN